MRDLRGRLGRIEKAAAVRASAPPAGAVFARIEALTALFLAGDFDPADKLCAAAARHADRLLAAEGTAHAAAGD